MQRINRRALGLAALAVLSWGAFGASAAELVARGFGGMKCDRWAQVSEDGAALVIDSSSATKELAWVRYALTAKDGWFTPGERYQISFRAKVEAAGDKGHLLVLVRPASFGTEQKDAASVGVDPTDGAWKEVSIPVEISTLTDYRLQFHSWNRVKAEIRDLRIAKRAPLAFVPVKGESAKVAVDVSAEPTGAKEFDVDLPKGTGPVLTGAAFGVTPENPDNTAALQAAFDAAKAQGASRLELAPGVYRFAKDGGLRLKGLTDFTFDGKGATLVAFRRSGQFFSVTDCVRTRLMDFAIDWDWARDPLASVVRVAQVDAGSFDFEFPEYADFPRKDMRLAIISAFDPQTRSVGIEDGVTRGFEFIRGRNPKTVYDWVAPNRIRVKEKPGNLAVGQLYRLQHYYYDMNGFGLTSNEHLRLERVKVLSTPGHAFVIGGTQHHTLFDHVDIVAPTNDPRRVITCTADHLHMARSRGFVKLDGCEFSLGADDIMNMHDCSGFGRRHAARVVRTQNARSVGGIRKGARVELRHGDYSPSGFIGTVESVTAVDARRGVYDLAFTEDVPEQKTDGFVIFDWTYDTHNVIVRNCYFHDNRARGLLILARDVTVENNVFRHNEMGAIKIETGYTFNVWSEGYGVSNVVVRNNLFDNVNPSGSNGGHRHRSVYTGIYLRRDPSADTTDYPIIRDLLFAGNTFRDTCGVVGYLSSVKNVTFRDNVFEDPTPRRKELPYRGQFFLTNARDVRIVNNRYVASPCVAAPGVAWDPETCERVTVEGNSVK